MPKKRLSFTQLKMYSRCPAAYFFRYIRGLKIPPTGAMFIGGKVDKAIGFNMEQKIESRVDKPADEVLDFFDTTFEKEKGEVDWKPEEDKGEIKDSGYKALKVYHTEFCPTIQPIIAQGELFIPLQGIPYDFIGYMDIVDEKETIIDDKVVGKSPSKDKVTGLYTPNALDSMQVATYAVGYKYQYGHPPKGLRLDYLVRTKEPKVLQVEVDKKEVDKGAFLRMLAYVSHHIQQDLKSGIFLPLGRLSYTQDCRRCGYEAECARCI